MPILFWHLFCQDNTKRKGSTACYLFFLVARVNLELPNDLREPLAAAEGMGERSRSTAGGG